MDANGLRFWMLAAEDDWAPSEHAEYDRARRCLRLRSERARGAGATQIDAGKRSAALIALDVVPQARDAFGTRAFWDAGNSVLLATGALSDPVEIDVALHGKAPTDVTAGYDGVLYLALDGAVVLHDLRGRWPDVHLTAAGFTAWRLAADPNGGVWAFDRDHQRLARVRGLPFPSRPYAEYTPRVARPCGENPTPPTMIVRDDLQPAAQSVVAIACSDGGLLALIAWAPDGDAADATLRLVDARGVLRSCRLKKVGQPYSVTWLGADTIAIRVASLRQEALVYNIETELTELLPVGDVYPLRDPLDAPFVHGVTLPPHYQTSHGIAPLYRISASSRARSARADGARALDGRVAGVVWHRIYLEASLPPHCGVRVSLAASDENVPPMSRDDWHEHRFGDVSTNGRPTPHGAWVPAPSEIPFARALLQCAPAPNRNGLFTALVQRSNRRVRALRGRYLWVRVDMEGDGRATPEVAAMRVYGSRFSFVDAYLPQLYRESLIGAEAEDVLPALPAGTANGGGVTAASTPADFLDRFLGNFEGVLTTLEDRIANAYLLTDPHTTTDDALEWLASWIGVAFDPAYPPARRRRMIEAAPRLFAERGTIRGLVRALDIATDDAVRRRQIVVLEDFRLRRTFATILGANLADVADPLLPGLTQSGNSYVGDTLFLGDEQRKEFLALYAADLPNADEEAAVEAFFDQLANRVTILVHQELEREDLGVIGRVVELEKPAHVSALIAPAGQSFLVGMASLVAVDSYLAPPVEPQAVRVGTSAVGVRDLLLRPASLDPRLDGGEETAALAAFLRPVADAVVASEVPYGSPFRLDATPSHSGDGRRLRHYFWTLIE